MGHVTKKMWGFMIHLKRMTWLEISL
jgi:hypothetical protein